MHVEGLRPRGVPEGLAITPRRILPSDQRNCVGTPDDLISRLNTSPACAPVNASAASLRAPPHDSGSGWLARPFLCDSFIRDSISVTDASTYSVNPWVILRTGEGKTTRNTRSLRF